MTDCERGAWRQSLLFSSSTSMTPLSSNHTHIPQHIVQNLFRNAKRNCYWKVRLLRAKNLMHLMLLSWCTSNLLVVFLWVIFAFKYFFVWCTSEILHAWCGLLSQGEVVAALARTSQCDSPTRGTTGTSAVVVVVIILILLLLQPKVLSRTSGTAFQSFVAPIMLPSPASSHHASITNSPTHHSLDFPSSKHRETRIRIDPYPTNMKIARSLISYPPDKSFWPTIPVLKGCQTCLC